MRHLSSPAAPVPIALVLVLLMAVGLTACGEDDSISQEELEQAVGEAKDEAATAQEIAELEQRLEDAEKGAAAPSSGGGSSGGGAADSDLPADGGAGEDGVIPADAKSCAPGVFAHSGTTSCAFAETVAADYHANPGQPFTSYSPTTGKSYDMSCTSDPGVVVCTGGAGAVVYLP